MGRGFYNYGDAMDEETSKETKQCETTTLKRKSFLTRLFIICVLTSAVVLSLRPLIQYIISGKVKEYQGDGIIRLAAVECWYPFDPTILWRNCLIFVLQYAIVSIAPGIVCGTDITFLCMSEDLCLQLRVIGITLRRSGQRAKALYKKTFKKEDNIKREDHFKRCLEHCISQSIQHHGIIINVFQNFQHLNRIILLWLLIGATFLLCLSGLLFVADDVSLLSKMTFLVFLSTELVHTFIFCWYGEQIQYLSMDIGEEFYYSNWFEYSHMIKHYLLIVQKRSTMSLRLSASGYMDANLNTYGNVLSSAYSYFNLLRAVNN